MPYKDEESRRACNQRYYLKNKQKYLDKNRSRREEVKTWIREYKSNNPCTDCGILFPYFVMEFDHLGDKLWNIADMPTKVTSIPKVIEEVAKCELVCANCHRIRTHARSQVV